MLKLKLEGKLNKAKALVVVPTGLLTNRQAEISRFAPSLTSFIYHSQSRDLKDFDADVMLKSYGVLRSDATALKKKKWAVMFIDEAQNIKNSTTAQSKAVKSIPADVHIALSGTPVENRLTEFWSIMDYANKGYLDNEKNLKKNYSKPISANSLTEELGLSSVNTTKKHTDYLHEPYLFFYLSRYNNKLKLMTKVPKKVYVVDNGFVAAKAFALSDNLGRMLENQVFIELLRRGYDVEKSMFYYRSRNDKEVDFVLRQGTHIQQLV